MRNCGSCVDFPHPVEPRKIVMLCFEIVERISARLEYIGSWERAERLESHSGVDMIGTMSGNLLDFRVLPDLGFDNEGSEEEGQEEAAESAEVVGV